MHASLKCLGLEDVSGYNLEIWIAATDPLGINSLVSVGIHGWQKQWMIVHHLCRD